MREYVFLTIVIVLLFLYIRYLVKFPEDFGYHYYRIKYYKKPRINE